MEGYETALLSSFYAYPTFTRRFGRLASNGTYQVSSQWQSGLQNGTQVGQILGLMLAGVIADRYGYKKTMLGLLMLVIAFIFPLFFADSIGMLFAGEISVRCPLGCLPDAHDDLRCEDQPNRASTILDNPRQSMLDHRAAYLYRCSERTAGADG